ncbi:MAG: hypothetical protein HC840_00900 [Leptolyngbyaceae cyanobacterium RM2_2_4]|nr:hypothetical protein [Leptolyngbyaceae cyanobacterium RM2_2_4]
MLNVKLTKIESTHNNLRTNEMVGKTGSIPEKDYDIIVFGKGIEFSTRVIQTTVVQESNYDKETKTFTFKTQNSTYTLEILDKTLTDEEIFSHGKYKP